MQGIDYCLIIREETVPEQNLISEDPLQALSRLRRGILIGTGADDFPENIKAPPLCIYRVDIIESVLNDLRHDVLPQVVFGDFISKDPPGRWFAIQRQFGIQPGGI